uniref:Piriformospora indica-insensitive protein 2-like n=1 Tax=Nelumbo nucifera TaxID=4432 RepID=A0A822YIR8_NELNU|nr:TPA_asm: hypothetical protein HUJ06_011278 [Nelumbo nucifera]
MKRFVVNIEAILLLVLLLLDMSYTYVADASRAPMEKREKEALYSAIQGFVGRWWNGSELYPDPCGWTPIQGVSCDFIDGFWYVTDLIIGTVRDNSFPCTRNVEFRHHLFELKHLKTLSFFNCFVSPAQRAISIPTQNWEKLAGSLESLEFSSNLGLIGQIPTIFSSLTKLQSNRFSGRIPASLGRLAQLLIFDLSRNSLSGSLPLTFGGLTSLLKLDLSNNLLEGKLPNELKNLKNLTLLDLRNNRFSGGLTQSLQEMVSLEEMVLSNNPIGGDLMSFEWEKMQSLIVLDLSNMGLTGEIPDTMAELKRLRFLGLNDNDLSSHVPPKLSAMPCLNTLNLYRNDLTGELQFSEWFYGKMGRRFAAWSNPNLCYPVKLMSTGRVPFGVKPCQQEAAISEADFKTKLGDENLNKDSHLVASLGFSSGANCGFWWGFIVKEIVIVFLLFDTFLWNYLGLIASLEFS